MKTDKPQDSGLSEAVQQKLKIDFDTFVSGIYDEKKFEEFKRIISHD